MSKPELIHGAAPSESRVISAFSDYSYGMIGIDQWLNRHLEKMSSCISVCYVYNRRDKLGDGAIITFFQYILKEGVDTNDLKSQLGSGIQIYGGTYRLTIVQDNDLDRFIDLL